MSPNQEQQFVKYPKDILAWRRFISGNAWTVLTVIIDKTSGWDKESDAVSNSQIAAETTLSESSIRRLVAGMNTTDGPLEIITLGARGIPVFRVRRCDRCQPDTPVNLTPLTPLNGCQPDTPPTAATTTTGVNLTPISAPTGVNLTPTTDVTNYYLRESLQDSLSIEAGRQAGCRGSGWHPYEQRHHRGKGPRIEDEPREGRYRFGVPCWHPYEQGFVVRQLQDRQDLGDRTGC